MAATCESRSLARLKDEDMPITIDLPQIGESVVEGIIEKWLKKPGDRLKKYEPLVEVVTDKVTVEVPSPVSGVLTSILADEGATVLMGAAIAEIEIDEAPPNLPTPQTWVPGAATTTGYLVKDGRPVGPTGGGMEEERTHHSPAVRRLAREHDVDLGSVPGTGAGGRITRKDVLDYLESQADESRIAPDEEVVPLSPVRRIIAQNMVRSVSQIPHAWSMVEVDVHDLVMHRERVKEEFRRSEGIDLTYVPFLLRAVAKSLKEHPMLNSAWGGDKILVKKGVHIGIAVAAPQGLVVPVVRDADSLSIAALAKTSDELTIRARCGKLSVQDVQGGTFTVNNTGAFGSIISYPIINHPQAAILTTEAIQKRAVVVDDTVVIRAMVNLGLSFDHRITDGSEAGAFLHSVKGCLEAMGPDTPIY